MSVYFDIHWWWRAEFGGSPNPYLEPENYQAAPFSQEHTSTVDESMIDSRVNLTTNPGLPLNVPSDADLPNWNWDELGDLGLNWY